MIRNLPALVPWKDGLVAPNDSCPSDNENISIDSGVFTKVRSETGKNDVFGQRADGFAAHGSRG
jgi:hypothetical protein